uniref:BPL/LPL catalytic domain-containing protein n=2 Tax=Caenorhabditis tropicalis TaxID=1561998 RepID=A0A1I7TTF5_9PELO
MTRCLYACSFDMFVDVIDAFSEKLLVDEQFQVTKIRSMFAPPQEIDGPSQSSLRPELGTSTLSLASNALLPRPLPILQHLFWGDRSGSTNFSTNDRYGSEGNLDTSPIRRHPGRPSSSAAISNSSRRRRYRSCNSPENIDSDGSRLTLDNGNEEFQNLPRYIRQLNQREFGSPRNSIANGYIADNITFNSLPRYIRQLDKTMFDSTEDVASFRSDRALPSSSSCSHPPTTSESCTSSLAEEITRPSTEMKSSNRESVERTSSTGSSISRRTPECPTTSGLKSHFTMDELRMIDETDTETVDTPRVVDAEKVNFAILAHQNSKEGPENSLKYEKRNGHTRKMTNGSVTIKLENGDIQNEKFTNSDRTPTPYPPNDTERPISEASSCPSDTSPRESFSKSYLNSSKVTIPTINFTQLPPVAQQNSRSKRSTSVVATNLRQSSQRRFSAFSIESDRGRSVSPSFEHYQNRSLRGFTSAANPNRGSTRNSTHRHVQLYQFLTSRSSSYKAMCKPNSVLVYTGGDSTLYSDIRTRLTSLLPPDEITVFNVSVEALRKQPWAEKSTVCVILASTKDLDDDAWEKIQAYFNQNGKIIFVCQNKLLASVAGCDSNKANASILRFAFGNQSTKLKETNKEFVKFLEKNMKKLPKSSVINETFRSKDVGVGANFTVVLKKDPDAPLFLYMQNNGSLHASALFSDATTQQLLAPNSNLLRESLQSVGVNVCETSIPSLTKGILVAEYDSIIDGIAGLRLGEEIGSQPRVLLRRTEVVEELGLPEATPKLLPIEVVNRDSDAGTSTEFDLNLYFNQLQSKIGQIILIVDVATTTMDIIESVNAAIPALESVVVVANRQIQGRGRGGNEFLCPRGMALFNFSFTVSKRSRLAKHLPIVQHIFCVAIVEAARSLSGYPDFPLRIKWPNDLYCDRSHKVGGMLLQCKTRDDAFQLSIGCGMNVSNEKPTLCLNDMLPKEAEVRISKEQLIAETLNKFTYYMMDYENNGPENFRKKYHEYWLHSQQEVLLSDFNERVTIRGIDDDGYLQVRSKTNPDKIFSIGDDGNTFDMMKGLIRHKY